MWIKQWVDDGEQVAISDDGLRRVVIRPDESDTEWDDWVSPAVVSVYRAGAEPLYGWRTWHASQESDDTSDALAVAVSHYGVGNDERIERYMRLYRGATAVHRISTRDLEYYACDSTELRALWGTPGGYVFQECELATLRAWFDGDVYSAHVQTRSTDTDDWEDTDDCCYGLLGWDWARDSGIDLLGSLMAHPSDCARRATGTMARSLPR